MGKKALLTTLTVFAVALVGCGNKAASSVLEEPSSEAAMQVVAEAPSEEVSQPEETKPAPEKPKVEASEAIMKKPVVEVSKTEEVTEDVTEETTEQATMEPDEVKTNHIRLADGTVVEAGKSVPLDKLKDAIFVLNGDGLKEGEDYLCVCLVTKGEYLVAEDDFVDWAYDMTPIKPGEGFELSTIAELAAEDGYDNIYVNFVNAKEREEKMDEAFNAAYDKNGEFDKELYKDPVFESETELNFPVEK